ARRRLGVDPRRSRQRHAQSDRARHRCRHQGAGRGSRARHRFAQRPRAPGQALRAGVCAVDHLQARGRHRGHLAHPGRARTGQGCRRVIRTLIVDDEKLARERLISFLRTVDDVEVVGQAKNGLDAVKMIEELAPDLVFLDVQMPGMDGFGVLKAVRQQPQVVFATAFDEYAINAFEVHAADYLLKPISRARLTEALRRVRQRLNGQGAGPQLQDLMHMLEARERRYLTQVPVHRGRQILVLTSEQILWFEVEYRLVYAHVDGDRYMT